MKLFVFYLSTILFWSSFLYQHFSNGIELYFSLLKSKLRKLEGLKYNELKENIKKVIKEIPKDNYKNILKGVYERQDYYIKKTNMRYYRLIKLNVKKMKNVNGGWDRKKDSPPTT